MSVPARDVVATILVAVALVLYGAWLLGVAIPGFTEAGAVTLGVLVLGVLASLSAVVPGFAELMRGSRLYMVTASAIGLVAFLGGLWTLFGNDPLGLGLLMAATLVLWAMSTWRHVEAARAHSF